MLRFLLLAGLGVVITLLATIAMSLALIASSGLGGDPPIPFPDWLPYILWSITAGIVLFTGLFLLKELLPRKKMEGKAIVIQLDREEVYRL